MVLLIFFNITQQFGKLLRKFSDASPNVGLFACVLQLEFILENGVFNKRTYYFLKNRINYVVSLRKDRHSSCVSYDFKVTEDYGLETEMQQQDTKYIIHGHVYARRRSKISLGRKGIECHLNHTIYKKKQEPIQDFQIAIQHFIQPNLQKRQSSLRPFYHQSYLFLQELFELQRMYNFKVHQRVWTQRKRNKDFCQGYS